MSSMLRAGIARIDITPSAGFRMQGIMSRIEGARGVESNLLATILILADETTKVVLVDCDLIGFDMKLVAEIRQEIGTAVGVPPTQVAVDAPHTHNGPCTSRGNLGGVHDVGGDTNERAALDFYIANLKDNWPPPPPPRIAACNRRGSAAAAAVRLWPSIGRK